MKSFLITTILILLLFSSCITSNQTLGSGDPTATMTGASIGGNLGGAIGGLIGEGNRGPRGAFRGSAIGSIIGTIAGAAIGNAVTAPKAEQNEVIPSTANSHDGLRIRNIRFIDTDRNHIISSGESCKVIFEIMNEGTETAYNIVPVVEAIGPKRLYISPSVVIEQLAPGDGVKYTANINADNRMKNGEITIHVAVADDYGQEYVWQEFNLQTER